MNFLPGLTIESIFGFALVVFRVAGVFLFAPLLSNRSVPNTVKVIFVITISFILLPIVSGARVSVGSHIEMMMLILQEVTIGFIIGLSASLVFSTIQMSGELMGLQLGFAMATIFDPANQTDSGVLTSFYIVLGALLFLYLDGHHLIITALGKSFSVLPLTKGFHTAVGYSISQLMTEIFIFSVQIVSPVLVVITVLNIMYGFVSKLSPQMNIYFSTGFIIGPVVGLIVLMLSLPLFRFVMTGMTERMEGDLLRIIVHMKGPL